jgi:hypothetical protein
MSLAVIYQHQALLQLDVELVISIEPSYLHVRLIV